ncbi:hypothetical protein BY996DRAFT_6799225 [Phakopsora pachyrhizi]|nr:hypothetical protein BY996DRAFT_6799225 [Phakopsora pachyrhizi]
MQKIWLVEVNIMLNSVYSPWLILSYLSHKNLIYVWLVEVKLCSLINFFFFF